MESSTPTVGGTGVGAVKSVARRVRTVAKVAPPSPAPRAATPAPRRDDAWLPWVVLGVVVVILGAFFVKRYASPFTRSNAWQAVFLTNGQTYFGHIVRSHARALVLTDVYYLTTQAVETEVGREGRVGSSTTLVRRGKELHGPTDEMRINPEHVLFTETLRDDATVVRAITTDRAATDAPNKDAAPTPPASPEKK